MAEGAGFEPTEHFDKRTHNSSIQAIPFDLSGTPPCFLLLSIKLKHVHLLLNKYNNTHTQAGDVSIQLHFAIFVIFAC